MRIVFILLSLVVIACCQNTYDKNKLESDIIFVNPEIMPEFPGGEQKMLHYIYSKFSLPLDSRQSGALDKAVISFIVYEDGCINEIKIRRSFGLESWDNEFIRVVASMPKWKPGKRHGKVVKVNYNLPLRINLK